MTIFVDKRWEKLQVWPYTSRSAC